MSANWLAEDVLGERGDAPTALSVNGLRVCLTGREIEIVSDVSFSLQPGTVLGLVGESGSGKTTVALALLGYSKPGTSISGGSVVVGGTELVGAGSRTLRQARGRLVSYVPQDPSSSLNPSLRIGEQIREVLDEHGYGESKAERSARLSEALTEVGLPSDREFLRRYPHQLSGGQQQRVAIATAFACRPKVVVLDEPTTGLDVTTQAHILATIKDLTQVHGAAAVYISHDLAVVAEVADRIAVMYAGQLVENGEQKQLIEAPAHPYTRRLLAAIPDPKQRRPITGIPGSVMPLGAKRVGCVFAPRCDFAEEACTLGRIAVETVAGDHAVRCRRWATARSAQAKIEVTAPKTERAQEALGKTVSISGLSAWYGGNEVLRGATLSVPAGRCVALVGESGSGKTTLARAISGVHERVEGELLFDGQPLPWESRRRSADARRAIQYIFQNPYGSLNPRKSVRQLLEQPLKHFGCEPEHDPIPALLEQVSLSPRYARRYPGQLSGGERQRIAIARALSVSPQILICDEITSALDVSVQASILSLLLRLHAETALTVLFITHNLAVVRAIADSVVVLRTGVIVEEGPTETVLDNPQHEYTKLLLADTVGLS